MLAVEKNNYNLSYPQKIKLLIGKNNWQNEDFDGLLPFFISSDGPVGLRHPKDLTIWGGEITPSVAYPSIQILANTWNKKLAYSLGKALGNDCIDQNVDLLLAPGVNIKRIPQCGRNFEYFSEDPYLSGIMALNYIKGVQKEHVGTCLKHYACNSTEINRKHVSSNIDDSTLRNIYLKQFEIALKAKPWAVMTSYNKINGIKTNCSKYLLDILRNEFKYKGLIMSDWEAVFEPVDAINAGLNYIMPFDQKLLDKMLKGYEEGAISKKTINTAVKPILDLLNKNEIEKAKRHINLSVRQRQNIADKIAEEGMVLLKNNGILPLKNNSSITVLGKPAIRYFCGGGSSEVNPIGSYSRLQTNLRKYGCFTGDNEKICIFTCGNYSNVEREELNRTDLFLSKEDEDQIHQMHKDGKKIIVVIYAGSVIDMSSWINEVDAVLYAGYSGINANKVVAKILTGRINPSGKLTESFANHMEDYPGNNTNDDFHNTNYIEKENVGYRYFSKHSEKVLFPFGFGLSYSNFSHKVNKCKNIVKVQVTNNSEIKGKDIIQFYVLRNNVLELIHFEKIELKPHETKVVEFICESKNLEEILTGSSSVDFYN